MNNGKQKKKSKKSFRKVESAYDPYSLEPMPGYLLTKGLKHIPEQYVYKNEPSIKINEVSHLSQFSPSPYILKQKPNGTQREEEEDPGKAIATEYEREKSPQILEERLPASRNFEHDTTSMNIASQI